MVHSKTYGAETVSYTHLDVYKRQGGYTVPDEIEKKLVEALEENNIFRSMANVIRTSSGTRKIPIAEDTGEASWIDEGEEIPESDTTFGQTMLSAYKLGTMIKVSNELLNDSAFDLATYIARRFGVRMGNAEEKAFITGDGVGKPLGILDDAGAKVGVTAGTQTKLTFDEIFQLYYALKAPYRKKAEFLLSLIHISFDEGIQLNFPPMKQYPERGCFS